MNSERILKKKEKSGKIKEFCLEKLQEMQKKMLCSQCWYNFKRRKKAGDNLGYLCMFMLYIWPHIWIHKSFLHSTPQGSKKSQLSWIIFRPLPDIVCGNEGWWKSDHSQLRDAEICLSVIIPCTKAKSKFWCSPRGTSPFTFIGFKLNSFP